MKDRLKARLQPELAPVLVGVPALAGGRLQTGRQGRAEMSIGSTLTRRVSEVYSKSLRQNGQTVADGVGLVSHGCPLRCSPTVNF